MIRDVRMVEDVRRLGDRLGTMSESDLRLFISYCPDSADAPIVAAELDRRARLDS